MNRLTQLVYERFTIMSELGEMEYSYAQPFFLSNTRLECVCYPFTTVQRFLQRCNIEESAEEQYRKHGILILRAAVMNPYITPMRERTGQSIPKLFLDALASAAEEYVRDDDVVRDA